MSILEDLTSKDPHRIWSGACAVRRLREPEALALLARNVAKIRRSTRGVELGGALHPNAAHLEFALYKLEFVREQRGCLCRLYTKDMFYDPSKEQKAGHVNLSQRAVLEPYIVDYLCQCSYCGQEFAVEEREYHYTWWSWRLL